MLGCMAREDRSPPTLLGFPVQVRPGFPVFLVLIVFLYGGNIGLWVAGAIGVFTVVHELGHAIAARSTGAQAAISLDFMMAYASYRPSRELRWWERTMIAISGPALQVAGGTATLLVMGVNPLSRDEIVSSDASLAVWWAGVALGLLNLIPVLPLDGGAVIASLIDSVAPGRGRSLMLRASVALTAGAIVVMIVEGTARTFAPFAAFLLVFQLQILGATNALRRAADHASGDPQRDSVVITTLLAMEDPDKAVVFGTDAWRKCPSAGTAVLVAQAHASREEQAAALQWLDSAAHISLDPAETLRQLDESPEFDAIRDTPAFVGVRELLVARGA